MRLSSRPTSKNGLTIEMVRERLATFIPRLMVDTPVVAEVRICSFLMGVGVFDVKLYPGRGAGDIDVIVRLTPEESEWFFIPVSLK